MVEAVVVFGGSGFVGRNLIARLAGRVPRIISVSLTGTPVPGAAESYAMGSLAGIKDLPAGTIAVNVAAHRYDAKRFDRAQSEILLANAQLTETLYAFCLDRGITEVRTASSVAVYPAGLDLLDDDVPVDLNRLPNPNETFYGWSKRWGEQLAQLYAAKYGIATLSFRISNVYGPLDSTDMGNAHVLPAFVMRALQPAPDFEIKGNPDVERDFVYVSDVCEVFESSFARRGETNALNLCTGQTTSLRELALTILRLAGEDRPLVATAAAVQGVAARRSPNRRLRETFGKNTFVSLEDGLRQTLDWYRHELTRP
jgi:nucleoside-diphosphate-sugar epimerase